jgi:alkylation response protein AidB-like acyl-CoA dehydrogenase
LKRRLLPRILNASDIWCQGFSEPDYGSDVASIKTRARDAGDGSWLINGQKVWTSQAPWATYCFVLCRTADPPPDGRKYDGLSMIITPIDQPEVVVTPLRQITGEAEYAQVFFNDARAPIDAVLGDANDGWNVAMTLLEFERSEQGFTDHSRLLMRLDDVRRYVLEAEAAGVLPSGLRESLRPRFVDAWTRCQLLGQFNLGRALALKRGERIGSWGSYANLYWSELIQSVSELAIDVFGAATYGDRDWEYDFLWSRATTIYSGTSEIQRNVMGDRLLGLPR